MQTLSTLPIVVGVTVAAATLHARGEKSALGDAYTVPNAHVETFTSSHVGVDYRLYVSLPRNYSHRTEHFPVVYLLDADYAFPIAHAVEEHLSDRGALPELILVGIAYTPFENVDAIRSYKLHRTRDYTPIHVKSGDRNGVQDVSGKANTFIRFLEEELIPHIEDRFRTDPAQRTLVGHSYGGLFGMYAILTRPHLFANAILVSPSFWYGRRFIFDFEETVARTLKDLPIRLYMATGQFERRNFDMVQDMRHMAARLRSRRMKGLQLQARVEPRANHHTVFPNGLTAGLRYCFRPGRRR